MANIQKIYGKIVDCIPGNHYDGNLYIYNGTSYKILPDDKIITIIEPEGMHITYNHGIIQYSSSESDEEDFYYHVPKENIYSKSGKLLWIFPGSKRAYPIGYDSWFNYQKKQWKSAVKNELIRDIGGNKNISKI